MTSHNENGECPDANESELELKVTTLLDHLLNNLKKETNRKNIDRYIHALRGTKLSLKPETYQRYQEEFFNTIRPEANRTISYPNQQEQFKLRTPLERN